MATCDEVIGFLSLFKGCVMAGRLAIKDREKNRQAVIDLGITPADRREVLLGLEPENYVAGPIPDDTDAAKDVWTFGKIVNGTEVYIKGRVVKDPRKSTVYQALVWSFHPAEFPLSYPLRGGGP
jgi:hypothetical protein